MASATLRRLTLAAERCSSTHAPASRRWIEGQPSQEGLGVTGSNGGNGIELLAVSSGTGCQQRHTLGGTVRSREAYRWNGTPAMLAYVCSSRPSKTERKA